MDPKTINIKQREDLLRSLLNLTHPSFQRLKPIKLYEKFIFKKIYFIIINILNDIRHMMNFDKIIKFLITNNNINKNYYTLIIKQLEELEKYHYNLDDLMTAILSKNKEIHNFLCIITKLSIFFNEISIQCMWNEKYHNYEMYNNYRNYFNKINNNYRDFINNLKILKNCFDSEITKIQNPTHIEKSYIEYLTNYLKQFNLVEVFSRFKIQFDDYLDKYFSKEMKSYENLVSKNINNTYKNFNLDKDFNLDTVSELQIEFLSNLNCCDEIKDRLVDYYASDKHKEFISNKFKFIEKNFSKPKNIISKATFIKQNYPEFFRNLPLYYRKKYGDFLSLSLSKRDYNSITIQDIINLNIHKSVDRWGDNPGIIYAHKINHNQIIESRKLNFYTSYRSIQFNYSLIPKNIFWSRKNNFYATNQFVVSFILSIKNSYTLNIPLEMIEIILNFVSIRDMCKHHKYYPGEIFNFK
jgi:hypothetical protein